jgi:phage tail sheath protein FI
MPEYLAPGVYVEEVSFRSKSIEGVSTSTAGFVGPARYGPVSGEPELIGSFADFERIYGGLDDLVLGGTAQPNYLAHAVRVFFEEGGRRLYIGRVFGAGTDGFNIGANGIPGQHYGAFAPAGDTPLFRLVARFPGAAGNLSIILTVRLGADGVTTVGGARTLQRVRPYDLVLVRTRPANDTTPGTAVPTGTDGLRVAVLNTVSGAWTLSDPTQAAAADQDILLSDARFTNAEVRPLTVLVEVVRPSANPLVVNPPELLGEFGFDPRGGSPLLDTFSRMPKTRLAALTSPFAFELAETNVARQALALMRSLFASTVLDELRKLSPQAADLRATFTLQGGDDGAQPSSGDYSGQPAFNDYINDPLAEPKNGLLAFEGLEDISIVAAPGYSATSDATERSAIHAALITHAEKMRYRIAVLDTPRQQLPSGALDFRNQRSSKYAAIYYPWVTIADPQGRGRLDLPPSGFVAGIYARNDNEHAVFKAPANEVVRTAIDFELRLTKAQQELLNPEGVNCFRFFEGRGYLLWGARTVSDDPEWKYVNLRRYFAYLERSIDRGTQWAVFETNNRPLWDNVRRTIEDFLYNEWKMGALMGDKPEQAFFVRCDLSTMTQNDIDNGRLVCLIGVAAVRPAEFVIFRIGQWTASARS